MISDDILQESSPGGFQQRQVWAIFYHLFPGRSPQEVCEFLGIEDVKGTVMQGWLRMQETVSP